MHPHLTPFHRTTISLGLAQKLVVSLPIGVLRQNSTWTQNALFCSSKMLPVLWTVCLSSQQFPARSACHATHRCAVVSTVTTALSSCAIFACPFRLRHRPVFRTLHARSIGSGRTPRLSAQRRRTKPFPVIPAAATSQSRPFIDDS
jgi:hypothetical protein